MKNVLVRVMPLRKCCRRTLQS